MKFYTFFSGIFKRPDLDGQPLCSAHDVVAASRRKALLLMFLIPFMWSVAGIFTRQLSSVSSAEIVFWRSLFVSLFVLAWLLARKKDGFFPAITGLGWAGLASGVMWAMIYTCFMLSLTMTTVANTLLICSITPFLTALFSWFFLGMKTSARTWIAIVFSFFGVTVIFWGSAHGMQDTHMTGLLFALVVPFSYAVNYMIFHKSGKTADMMPAVFLGGALSSLAMIPLAFPLEASMRDISILAFLGIFQLGIPCLLLVYVARFLPPTEIALIAMLEIVLGPLWVWIGVNETPSGETLTGGLIVLSCLLIHELTSLLYLRNKNSISSTVEEKQ